MPVKPTKKSIKQEIKKARHDRDTMNTLTTKVSPTGSFLPYTRTPQEMSAAKAGYKSKIKSLKKQKRSM